MEGDPDSAWSVERRGDAIWVTMRGYLTPDLGRAASARFLELLGSGRAKLVFDVRDVSAYPSEVRKAWQEAVWPARSRIVSLAVISQSQLTRMGALMFAKFLGLDCQITDDPAKLR